MIELKVEEYCHDCPEFEAHCNKDAFVFTNGQVHHCNTIITCEHAGRCASIKNYLEKSTDDIKEAVRDSIFPAKEESTCDACEYSWRHKCCKCDGNCSKTCEMYDHEIKKCKCAQINWGQPCPYFKEYNNEKT